MKKVLLTSLCAALLLAFAVPALYAVDAPADMELKVPEGATATKNPVMFSHKQHVSDDCKVCHHKWDGSGEPTGCSADGCHTNMADKKSDDSYYKAFHDSKSMQSCVGCHRAKKKAGEATGPTSCTQCHPK